MKTKGFTLVEILVVIAVAAVMIVSLNSVVTGYMHVSQRGRYLSLANAYIEAKVEGLRNNGYNSLSPGTYNLTGELTAQLPPSRAASMVVGSSSGGLKQVDISVSYKDQGQTNSYDYTTYIGELGVGQ